MNLITVLAIVNIPVYLFCGCLVFDNKGNAGDTFVDTIVAILKMILVPRIIRVLLGDDDDEDAWGIVPILAFFFVCGGIVYGEYYLIHKYWH
jgi:hypothetical protein